jgi:hypothetical protein
MSVTSRDIRRPLPGHKIVSLVLAVGIWAIGAYFTGRALPLGAELGPAAPFLVAIALQALLTLAQSNIRVFGLSGDRWPLVIMVLLDVILNWFGIMIAYVEGVETLGDAGLYVLRGLSTGAGLWQSVASLVIGALIAASPEVMARDAMKG